MTNHLVVVDAAQIEARVVAWLLGEEQVLEAFRQKRDIYSEFASDAYQRTITKADVEERFVGKTCVLGLGFGMGGVKLQSTLLTKSVEQGLDPIRLPIEICYNLVQTYRTKYSKIKEGWKIVNDSGISAMLGGTPFKLKCVTFEKGKILLPNGLALLYPGLDANIVKTGSRFFKGDFAESIQDASYLSARKRSKVYGGLLVENCLTAKSLILTPSGFKRIIDVTLEDKVWDGTQWVFHTGVIHKGKRSVSDFGGVGITPEHRVKVCGKWTQVKDTTYEEASSSFERSFGNATREACSNILKILPKRADPRSEKQQGVLQSKLPVSNTSDTGKEYEGQSVCRYPLRENGPLASYRDFRNWADNLAIQSLYKLESQRHVQETELNEQDVYDITNAGPNHCFTVRGENGGLILAHNCVQALARIIVSDVMLLIAKKCRIVMITHDEIVFVAPKKEAQASLDWAIGLMSESPIWAPDLPLSAEGSHDVSYSK